ncbi:prolipoprotein diacylglyceryl transferase [Saccharopolyspora hirsuta]|uniref:Phosphatidylglycerol--prolipoprotein diacylglyceryl transferase n=1 Tax=Saccharopolyspora hirsuta TaxID=1837 RepID=A0A5M7BSN3_SACHI|nr:prolipoprotein diacylglyceryl transferase [Saccharopolyspora hirsuta]KAA5831207.1 prolipoprotein diacylglyceryl transferase [Saccharopolyspora hirsuta]
MSAPVAATANSFLANIPSPPQGVWYIGPVPLRAYALCIIAGIIAAVWIGSRRWVARGGTEGTVIDIAVFAVPFGLVGGRLYHVATDWHKYFGPDRNPLDALKIWEGGLGIWGAVALGAVGAWIGCRRRGVPLAAFADAVAPGIILAQAIGRLGNWFNQELYGAETTVPWGLEIYRRVDPATGLNDPIGGVAVDSTPMFVVHPTFLYELLWNLLVFALVLWADRKFRMGHGRVFALYVAGYTLGRLWIEMMRTDDATLLFGIRINIFTSLIVFAGAVLYLVIVRGGREDPEQLKGKPMPGEAPAEPKAKADVEEPKKPEADEAEPEATEAKAEDAGGDSGSQARSAEKD